MSYQVRSSTEFENDLLDLVKVDDAIGAAAKKMATQAKILNLESQIRILNKEKQDVDAELQKVIEKLHQVFGSKRYKIGNFFIRPIEIVLGKGK